MLGFCFVFSLSLCWCSNAFLLKIPWIAVASCAINTAQHANNSNEANRPWQQWHTNSIYFNLSMIRIGYYWAETHTPARRSQLKSKMCMVCGRLHRSRLMMKWHFSHLTIGSVASTTTESNEKKTPKNWIMTTKNSHYCVHNTCLVVYPHDKDAIFEHTDMDRLKNFMPSRRYSVEFFITLQTVFFFHRNLHKKSISCSLFLYILLLP